MYTVQIGNGASLVDFIPFPLTTHSFRFQSILGTTKSKVGDMWAWGTQLLCMLGLVLQGGNSKQFPHCRKNFNRLFNTMKNQCVLISFSMTRMGKK